MEMKYIKMNDNKDYLSLGNVFNILKKYSKNINSAMQVELFYSIFNINDVNKTTINNYLIGYRPIGLEYKKIFFDLKEKYKYDKSVFIDIVLNVLTILDEYIYTRHNNSLDIINDSDSLKLVCRDLILLSEEDSNITNEFKDKIKNMNLYECFIEVLLYSILENKQPIYKHSIDEYLKDNELEDYLKINLFEGMSYINSLKELARRGNMYANAELGSLEFSGVIDGEVNYNKSFKYYLSASKSGHPKACFMVANLLLTKRVSIDNELEVIWENLNKAIKLGSVAAINAMGNCYKNGINPEGVVDLDKALEYYKEASKYDYVYAYNNIGLLYEEKDEMELAIKYYKLSADMDNSWALNKMGEIKRKSGDLVMAFYYYNKSIETPISIRNYWGYYNLAKYFYMVGNKTLGIKKDKEKANEYFDIFYKHKNKKRIE